MTQQLVADMLGSRREVDRSQRPQTAEFVAEELGFQDQIQTRPELYLCPVSVWESLIQQLPESLSCVLCVGHNDGLEMLVSQLRPRHRRHRRCRRSP